MGGWLESHALSLHLLDVGVITEGLALRDQLLSVLELRSIQFKRNLTQRHVMKQTRVSKWSDVRLNTSYLISRSLRSSRMTCAQCEAEHRNAMRRSKADLLKLVRLLGRIGVVKAHDELAVVLAGKVLHGVLKHWSRNGWHARMPG